MSAATLKIAVGLGCDRGTPLATLQQALDEALALAGACLADVAAAASIDLKADEPGLLALAALHGWRMTFYTPAQLAAVPVPNPSETVRKYTGSPSVSEAAALLAASATGPGALRHGAAGRKAQAQGRRWAQRHGFISPLPRFPAVSLFLVSQP